MNKRPKSREETPKEGSDSARRYRTAIICRRAAQSARAFEIFPHVKSAEPGRNSDGQNEHIVKVIQLFILELTAVADLHRRASVFPLAFVMHESERNGSAQPIRFGMQNTKGAWCLTGALRVGFGYAWREKLPPIRAV
jgi:hypothetical protein